MDDLIIQKTNLKEIRMKSLGIFLLFIALTTVVDAQKKRTIFDDVDFIIEPVDFINTTDSDISPSFVNDSIYFSGVSEKYINKKRREKRNIDFYNIYSVLINRNGIVSSTPSLVSGFGNEFHEGPVDYCETTDELFVTLSNTINSETIQKMIPAENIRLHLAIKKRINGKWQTVEELPFNDKRFHFAQPAISVTGDTLVFSSDLKPNYGSTDLFMSIRKNGEWSTPVNLGDSINTPGDEMFPTFIAGGLLSFASNGRSVKYGGLDIYYTNFPEPLKVEILDNDINTQFDEFGLIIHKNGNVGYFTSNRSGEGNDDIFKLNIKKQYKTFNVKVTEDMTNLPISGAEAVLRRCEGDIINKVFSDSTGSLSLEISNTDCLQIEILKEGYENDFRDISGRNSVEFKLKQKKFYEILVIDVNNMNPVDSAVISCDDQLNFFTNSEGIVSKTPPFPDDCELLIKKEGYLLQTITPVIKRDSAITKDTVWFYKKELNSSYMLGNINSDSGELRILKESTEIFKQLLKIMKLNTDLKIEIGWHTDSKGQDAENKRLSQNRADFAVNYLVINGIEKERAVGKGYGESQLINKCKNGVQCSEDEHKENRRIEFKIIGFLNP